MTFKPGIRDAKDLQAFTDKMAGKGRAASTSKPKRSKAAAPNPPTPNQNTVIGNDTKIPAPAKDKPGKGINVIVNIGKEYC